MSQIPADGSNEVDAAEAFITASPEDDDVDLPPLNLSTSEIAAATDKHNQLLNEAQLRAEHQALARGTMLDLMKALAEANRHRSELARQLQNEQLTCKQLRATCDRLETELDEALLAEEQRQADLLLKKGFEKNNSIFLGMMLEKSREAYSSTMFTSVAGEDSKGSLQQGSLQQGGLQQGGLQQGSLQQGSCPNSLGDVFGGIGDKVTFEWVVKLWKRQVELSKQKRAEEAEKREQKRLEEEKRRKIQEEIERRVGEVQKLAESLAKQLEGANKEIEAANNRTKNRERQFEIEKAEMMEHQRELLRVQEQLQAECEQRQKELAALGENFDKLQADYDKAQESLRNAAADHEADKRAMQENIRNLTSELQQAIVMAKYMREMAMKAKRDAASCVSPEKFTQLISELEAMKARLGTLLTQYEKEKSTNLDLMSKLDKNKRRLELERQFLPLIRQARGPLGPKATNPKRTDNNTMEAAPANFIDASEGFEQERHLQRSQSLGSRVGHGGSSRGFALNAVGGS